MLLLILWILDKNVKEKIKQLFKSQVFVAIFLFISYSFLSLLWVEHIDDGLHFFKKYFYLLAIIVFITDIDYKNIFKIISAFLLGMFISEILSYGIFFNFWTLRHGSPTDPSPFMYHTFYGLFLAFTSLIVLNKIFFKTHMQDKLLYALFFTTVTSNLFLNTGRTGYLTFSITIFILGFVNIKNKLLAFFSIFILLVSIFLTSYQISPIFKKRFEEGRTEVSTIFFDASNRYNGSFGQRLAVWTVGMNIFKENPLLGTGIGDELHELKNTINTKMPQMKIIENIEHYHNDYISYLVQLGIIGLILYINIFYQILKLKILNKELSNIKYIFVTSFSMASFVDFIFIGPYTLPLFTLFTSIFIVASQKNLNAKSKI